MKVISEGPKNITKATIDAAWRRRKPDHRLIVRDLECRGLALIVNPTGMTWSYAYRPRGSDPVTGERFPNRTVSLGSPESDSVDDVRDEANRIKGQVKKGADPAAEQRETAAKARRDRALTPGRVIDDYAVAFARRRKMRGTGQPSPDYVKEEVAQLRMALSDMDAMDRPVIGLTTKDVRLLIDNPEINARGRFAALTKFLDWCQDVGHISTNPCATIPRSRRPRAPRSRDRYLVPTDLAKLWSASASLREPVWRDLCRFLIAVPCRRTEAAELDWVNVDLGKAEWRQPAQTTKNGEPHRLHLHPLALGVLRDRREATNGKGLVFPAPKSEKPIDTFTLVKGLLSDSAGIADWTWHDLRRSFVTALAEAGISETIADGILNHKQSATRGGVLGVYQRASRWPEQVKAMEHWGRLLEAAIGGRVDDAVVVPLLSRNR
jgi:integrase